MTQHTEHTWEVKEDQSLSVCDFQVPDGMVGFTLVDYSQPSFSIRFLPCHLPKLRELVRALERRIVEEPSDDS